VLQWDLARAVRVLPQAPYPLELSSHAGRGGWTAGAPTCQKYSSCGCRERCGGDDGVRNTAHAELTLTAAGTVLPLSAVQLVVYTPVKCLAALREASAGTRGDGYAPLQGLRWIPGRGG
jgi:hypothetical protein